MAGIGFELEKILQRESYTSMLHAYSYAIIVSTGPWLFSIIAILLVVLLAKISKTNAEVIIQFKTLVVYMISASLIISSIFQYTFSRFIADSMYDKKTEQIKPNFYGACLTLTIFSLLLSICLIIIFLPDVDIVTRGLTLATLVTLSLVWLCTISLSGAKVYKQITISFFLGYSIICVGAYFLRQHGLNQLMACFLVGQVVLLLLLILTMRYHYPSKLWLGFAFLRGTKAMPWLIASGVFYNLGLWIDKYLFWFHSQTSTPVIGLLNLSYIYDTPIFISTLTSIFSIAFFFLFIETSFVKSYKNLFDQICYGGTLAKIRGIHNELIQRTRDLLLGVIKIQVIISTLCFFLGSIFLKLLHIDPFYIYILNILVLALGLSVMYWVLLEVLFYLNKYRYCTFICALFFFSNLIFTNISIKLGVFFYGYGIALSLLVTTIAAFLLINRAYKKLEYAVFAFSTDG
ncbi:MAG: exopolysaccharide Pel transporter PelG [Legionellales bacterium]|nr:exopolysaccharide Pel transporter PelG [Legionellales bacterium]